MRVIKFLNFDFELDSGAYEATLDQKRPFSFKRVTRLSPEPIPREPVDRDFHDQLLAEGVSDEPEVWFVP